MKCATQSYTFHYKNMTYKLHIAMVCWVTARVLVGSCYGVVDGCEVVAMVLWMAVMWLLGGCCGL